MKKLKPQTCCLLACAAVLMAPLASDSAAIVAAGNGSPSRRAVEVDSAPETGSVLMLAAGLVVAGCMRRRRQGLGDFEG
jgi:hypothetical protein